MKISRFAIEYTDVPWKESTYIDDIHRLFKLKIMIDNGKMLSFERVLSGNDFNSILNVLFKDAKIQIEKLVEEASE